jgi:adenosylhomocysteine nucleosidase
MRIGIVIAMDSEFAAIEAILSSPVSHKLGNRVFLEGIYGAHQLIVCVGGMGKANAGATVALMLVHFGCELIISTGCAGGISADLRVGDIVVGADYCYHDVWCAIDGDDRMGVMQGTPRKLAWQNEIAALFDSSRWLPGYHQGHFYTGDQFIQTQEAVNKIYAAYPEEHNDGLSGICDMESMALAQICHQFAIPFVGFRVVSDTPCAHADAAEEMAQYKNFWQSMSDVSYRFLKSFIDSYKG